MMKTEKVKRSLVMRKKLTKNRNKSLGGEEFIYHPTGALRVPVYICKLAYVHLVHHLQV